MRRWSFALLACAACSGGTTSGDDASTDASSGIDASTDASVMDAPSDVASDGPTDYDAGICGTCKVGQSCCTMASSPSYAQCYDKSCLACCM